MPREHQILKYLDISGKGLEIAPYFNPLLPKRDGNSVLILDVVDTQTLRKNAQEDRFVPKQRIDEIEEVDIVGDASQLLKLAKQHELVDQLDYIVSSHNFEHLPNPVKFLQGAEQVLKPGGVLSMAVPDCRACFDFFRMPTRLSDWLQAFHEDRKRPTAETIFDQAAYRSVFVSDHGEQPGCHISIDSPDGFKPTQSVCEAYDHYGEQKEDEPRYIDSHCSVFFPEILNLLLLDLRYLGLVTFEVEEISSTMGHEFFVHLKKSESPETLQDEEYYEERERLLRAVSENLGASVYLARQSSVLKALKAGLLSRLRTLVKIIRSASVP